MTVRTRGPGRVGAVAAMVLAVGLVLSSLFPASETLAAAVPLSMLAGLVVLAPFLLGSRTFGKNPVHGFAAISIVIGGPVRMLGAALNDEWREFFFPGSTVPSNRSLGYYVVAVCALTIGLSLGNSGEGNAAVGNAPEARIERFKASMDRRNLLPLLVVILLSLLAFAAFTRQVDGLSLTNFSLKPRVFLEVQAGDSAGSFIALRILNELALTMVVLFAALTKPVHRPLLDRVVFSSLLGFAAVVGLAIPFVSSEREVIVSFGATAILILYRRGQLRLGQVVVIGFSVMILFGVLTELRSSSEDRIQLDVGSSFVADASESFVRNRNLADISKSALIVDAIPNQLTPDDGQRQFGALLGVVPRALWPGKPVIGAGPEVSATLYGNENSGIPPGLIAESYWSFEWFGLLVVFIVGLVAGRIERAIGRSDSTFGYAIALWIGGPILIDSLGVGLGFGVTGVVIRVAQITLVYGVYLVFSPLPSSATEIHRKPAAKFAYDQ